MRHGPRHLPGADRPERHAPVPQPPGADRRQPRAPGRAVRGPRGARPRARLDVRDGGAGESGEPRRAARGRGRRPRAGRRRERAVRGRGVPAPQGRPAALRHRPPRPGVPGALGPKGARLAGAHCDGLRAAAQWHPGYAGLLKEHMEAGAKEAGRAPGEAQFVAENWTFVHPDRELARREARALLATFLPALGAPLAFHGVPESEREAALAAKRDGATERLAEISDRTLDLFMAAGDAGDLRAGLDRLEAAGITAVSFSGQLGPDTALALEIIGEAINGR
ncbi:LLM class flavin-dependent oxidoreductase [Actinomadura sp. J1-007]|nr:LLM class flavin-dependent oxidoreductase [Actinomadura sp. J1-007]